MKMNEVACLTYWWEQNPCEIYLTYTRTNTGKRGAENIDKYLKAPHTKLCAFSRAPVTKVYWVFITPGCQQGLSQKYGPVY